MKEKGDEERERREGRDEKRKGEGEKTSEGTSEIKRVPGLLLVSKSNYVSQGGAVHKIPFALNFRLFCTLFSIYFSRFLPIYASVTSHTKSPKAVEGTSARSCGTTVTTRV